jgi:hypothetical protein
MLSIQKSCLLLSLTLVQALSAQLQPGEPFQLDRVILPSSPEVRSELYNQKLRNLKRYAVGAGTVVGVLTALYLVNRVYTAAVQQDVIEGQIARDRQMLEWAIARAKAGDLPNLQPLTSSDIALPASAQPGFFSQAAHEVKSFAWGSSKFIAGSILWVFANTLANIFCEYSKNRVKQNFADETILWYVHEKTTILPLFNDLKMYATDYDLYASLLNAQMFNQDIAVHLKGFMQDLCGAASRTSQDQFLVENGYLSYLFDEVKKKYIKKSSELEKRQEFVDAMIAKKHRAELEGDAMALFTQDMKRRQDIVQMCNLLVQDMNKTLTFILLRGGVAQQVRISDIATSCNAFLEHMEKLLNATPLQLQIYSKADRGMFTSIYEFEKLFNEHINFLHRYCKLNL